MSEARPDADRQRASLLMHSLAELREFIFSCLDIADVRSVVEVGAEEGTFTRELIEWAEDSEASVYCVEPAPTPTLVEMCEASPAVELVAAASPAALEDLDRADAYVIDGDHNYYTVLRELQVIEGKGDGGRLTSLVFLQDIGWPWGRRDLYYSPESLPPEAVHPHTYDKGVTLGSSATVRCGFRGEGQFAIAVEEGGPANGVLTAVEDFLGEREGLVVAKMPSVFGVAVVYPASGPHAEALSGFLAPYHDNPLLERLERNRLDLYLKVLALQDTIADLVRQLDKSSLEMHDVRSENRALWTRIAELEAGLAPMRGELENLLHSRAFALAERVSAVTRLRGTGPGISRQRVRAALEGESMAERDR